MDQSSANFRSHCPINYLLETIGDKWTLLIVRDLMFKGKHYFGEFLKSDEGISTNILTDRLNKLEDCGVVTKQIDADNATRQLYNLTSKGQSLLPVMLEITRWSAQFDELTNADKALVKLYEKDPQQVIEKIKSNW